MIKAAEHNKMANRHLVGSPLITGVHGLGSPQIIGSSMTRMLFLRTSMVCCDSFTQKKTNVRFWYRQNIGSYGRIQKID